jgi:glycosyltransferase involved in cell wall biosynthesis
MRKMIWLYSDVLYAAGGIETYLHALARHLHAKKIPCRVVVAEMERCPLVDELAELGIDVYRQRRVPGDRWLVRQRVMMMWLRQKLQTGDWVYCVRQPMPQLYLPLVRLVHRRQAKLAASWMVAPEFLPSPGEAFNQAIDETDAVISVSQCTVDQFRTVYGYNGPVSVVPYHNLLLFDKALPLSPGPPWKIGYLGRLEMKQKNLDQLLRAFESIMHKRSDLELHFYGRGSAQGALEEQSRSGGLQDRIFFHGPYDHRRDLKAIMKACHFFIHPSRYEGGPCFSLLEMMQAGRFCIAAQVGGIPDLYEGHPEAGLLIPRNAGVDTLAKNLEHAANLVSSGQTDNASIRARYFDGGFDLEAAHRAWTKALALVS